MILSMKIVKTEDMAQTFHTNPVVFVDISLSDIPSPHMPLFNIIHHASDSVMVNKSELILDG